jgi:hypothetical protein
MGESLGSPFFVGKMECWNIGNATYLCLHYANTPILPYPIFPTKKERERLAAAPFDVGIE